MQQLMTAERGLPLVLRLGLQRLLPLGFVLVALMLSAALVPAVSAM